MKKIILIPVLFAISAMAEVRVDQAQFIGVNTNAPVAASTLQTYAGTSRGFLLRVDVTVDATAKTNTVIFTDTTGIVLLSNQFTTGTTRTWFTNNPVPFVGCAITQYGASPTNSAALPTNTVTILYRRDN